LRIQNSVGGSLGGGGTGVTGDDDQRACP